MGSINSITQLSTFTLLRSILLNNSVLASKFNVNNIVEFEPKPKSVNFCGYPYIWINIPEVDDDEEYLGNQVRHKFFDVEIILRMDYLAKDNYSSYASNIISSLDSATSNSTMQSSGYYISKIQSSKPERINLDQKELVEGLFELSLEGDVV